MTVAVAAEVLGALAQHDVPLGPMTTYRVGGSVALFVVADSIEQLRVVSEAAHRSGLSVLMVGRGSNMLVADSGVEAIAVRLGEPFERVEIEGTTVVAGGAVTLPVLARRTVAAGLTGLEWCVGVPGTVGGGVRMNAGGHGSDMAASVTEVHRFDLRTGDDGVVPVDCLELGFRSSNLSDNDAVLTATFSVRPGDRIAGEAELAEIVRWRREHQPGGQNCGSVFVNPLPLAAGALVDGLGLRGLRIGSAAVSDKHANFIQADDGGLAADVLAVMREVRARVLEAHGVALRSEVRLVGFGDDVWEQA